MKGKTIIELTNVNTGEVTTYEDENLITYGANKYINTGYFNYNSYRTHADMLPVSEKALGGILLFDNTLEEDPNNYHLPDPSVAKLIGHAGREISTYPVDDTRGSFMEAESGKIENGYKSVWNFGASQGNGNISSICLTNHIFGYLGLKNWGEGLFNFYRSTPSVDYPIKNAYLTWVTENFNNRTDYFSGSLSTSESIPSVLYSNNEENPLNEIEEYVNMYLSNNTTLKYEKRVDRKNNVRLNYSSQFSTMEEKDITIDSNALENISSSYFLSFQRNPKDNKYYSIAVYNNRLIVVKFDLETQKLEKEISLALVSTYPLYTSSNMRSNFVIRDNNFYTLLRSGNSYDILLFKIDLLNKNYVNLTDKIGGSFSGEQNPTNIAITPNETIILPVGLLDKNDNFYSGSLKFHRIVNNNTGTGTLITNSLISNKTCPSNLYDTIPNIFYLGSINNLSTPITKTSDHTMKITYILTEE